MGNQLSQLIEAPSQGQMAGARGSHADSTEADERSARQTLRAQIGQLERELAAASV